MIHPLGQAHLDAQKACYSTYDAFIACIREQFGPKSNAYTQSDKAWNQKTKEAYSAFRNSQTRYVETLDAMRRANVTVHPI
jgi:hypothetical protein